MKLKVCTIKTTHKYAAQVFLTIFICLSRVAGGRRREQRSGLEAREQRNKVPTHQSAKEIKKKTKNGQTRGLAEL